MKLARLTYALNHVYILGISAVLLGAYGVQFIAGEYPCPLCVLQRMGMMLAAMGAVMNIVRGPKTSHFALAIIGALIGASISARQILLHIAPDDPGYGSPVLGMHMYSWAFVVFVVVIALCALHLLDEADFAQSSPPPSLRAFSKFTLGLFALIILCNAVTVFCEAGFHWFLPANPDSYRLFSGN